MLPEIEDDELVIYHMDDDPEQAMALYIERTGLTSATTDLNMIAEMFDWEWQRRLYGGQEP